MGDARRRKLLGLPKVRTRAESKAPAQNSPTPPLRSPQEVEDQEKFNEKQQAIIAASLDFLYESGEHAMREQIRRNLALHSKACLTNR